MKIEKLDYSSNPWRLTRHGKEIWIPTVFDHPDLGPTLIDGLIAGNTKKECLSNVLKAFGQLIDHVNADPPLHRTPERSRVVEIE